MLAIDGGHPLRAAANDAFADGLQLAETLAGTGAASPSTRCFPGNGLGTQLREVAKLIKLRSQIGPGRQVFFCSMGGFDTHTSQDGNHTGAAAGAVVGAWRRSTSPPRKSACPTSVTAFTQSEFGRTLQPNGTGTDHAWGSHQFVLGGAVRGRHLRPAAGVRAGRPRRRRQPRRVDSDDRHVAVRRHARQVVRRLAGRAGRDVPEPGQLRRRKDVGFML